MCIFAAATSTAVAVRHICYNVAVTVVVVAICYYCCGLCCNNNYVLYTQYGPWRCMPLPPFLTPFT